MSFETVMDVVVGSRVVRLPYPQYLETKSHLLPDGEIEAAAIEIAQAVQDFVEGAGDSMALTDFLDRIRVIGANWPQEALASTLCILRQVLNVGHDRMVQVQDTGRENILFKGSSLPLLDKTLLDSRLFSPESKTALNRLTFHGKWKKIWEDPKPKVFKLPKHDPLSTFCGAWPNTLWKVATDEAQR